MKFGKCVKLLLVSGFLLASVLGNLFAQVQAGSVIRRVGLFIGSNNGGRDRVMLRYAVTDARAALRYNF